MMPKAYFPNVQMREFHAHPLPVGEDLLPPKKKKPVTIPEPFELEADERGAKRLQEFSQKVSFFFFLSVFHFMMTEFL